MRPTWDRVLKHVPATGDPRVDANLVSFRDYFETQWLTPQMIHLANQFHNTGPRTTNKAEGKYHGLQCEIGCIHLRMAVFLVKFQKIHYKDQVRCMQFNGGAPPRAGLPQYAQNDANIQLAKAQFSARISFMTDDNKDAEIIRYLHYVQNLLGNQLQ